LLLFILKKNSKPRLYINYRQLNSITRKCYRSRHKLEYNVLNRVVIEEGYVRVTMRS
ncbi:uncharacterized protein K441DRAFT_731496, partial [Cenococcum geophilum 1.58]|uniref:uncharacterized protein n=1 Tax=Cenococcum geophilum 1.58 TaxID=794803 RepID=UPI00358DF366